MRSELSETASRDECDDDELLSYPLTLVTMRRGPVVSGCCVPRFLWYRYGIAYLSTICLSRMRSEISEIAGSDERGDERLFKAPCDSDYNATSPSGLWVCG